MGRSNVVWAIGIVVAVLVIGSVIYVARRPPEPGTAASFRAMSAASGVTAPYSVPVDLRRANADTCVGYNLELEEGAGIQTRIGNQAEAQRLLSMKQSCVNPPSVVRSAR